jgi:hypothetical protein
VHFLIGDEDLEVVGESFYQAALWASCGAQSPERVRCEIGAVLVPDPGNVHDSNAVAVYIDGNLIGHLDRQTASTYHPAIVSLMAERGGYIGLTGVIVGGGVREHGPGLLGVWLDHDPTDFGVRPSGRGIGRSVPASGAMRTGFSEAWLTDAEDDSYDLSWYDELPDADRPAITMLHGLLESDPDPIDRHFQFAELEARLYRCRDLYDSALEEFDEACRRHDAEMETICRAFMAKWNKVPLLETYRQMAIRQQKKKDWQACRWWAERGLSLYGSSAAREDAVEDLQKRRNRADDKLAALQRVQSPKPAPPVFDQATVILPALVASAPPVALEVELLRCDQCETDFERLRVRGRKPRLCPECRAR